MLKTLIVPIIALSSIFAIIIYFISYLLGIYSLQFITFGCVVLSNISNYCLFRHLKQPIVIAIVINAVLNAIRDKMFLAVIISVLFIEKGILFFFNKWALAAIAFEIGIFMICLIIFFQQVVKNRYAEWSPIKNFHIGKLRETIYVILMNIIIFNNYYSININEILLSQMAVLISFSAFIFYFNKGRIIWMSRRY